MNGKQARIAKLKVDRAVKGKVGDEVLLTYFPGTLTDFAAGKRYLVFYVPIVVSCPDVVNTAGIVELRDSVALTNHIYEEPASQSLDALLSHISEMQSR